MTNRFFSRRDFLRGGASLAAASILPISAWASVPVDEPLHFLSTFGDHKYGRDFTQFDYANPDAPKGGTFSFQPAYWYYNQRPLTFNTLNSFVRTGDAPPRMEFCFDTLMEWAWDEPDTIYGRLAESVTLSADRKTLTFKLRPEARFHDGSPLTAHDVAFSYKLLKEKGHPQHSLPLTEMIDAVVDADDVFRLVTSGSQSIGTTLNMCDLPPILSRKWVEEHGFDSSKTVPLLGSGPYKVGRFNPGSYIEYKRDRDYWARDLPFARGLDHFDTLRIDFYRNRDAGFEAFKKGSTHFRQEFTSQQWATGYDFPAIRAGKVVRREVSPTLRPAYQAYALNQRRERFRDLRVRQAIELCFDFEWMRRNLFYGSYRRADSLFENSPYKAEGFPSPEEKAILDSLPGNVPEEAFGEAIISPTADGSGKDRKVLRKAKQLMIEAGWRPDGSLLKNEAGETFTLELLFDSPGWERVMSPYVENLRAIGIDASLRIVDAAQYQERYVRYDFDMVTRALRFDAIPTKTSIEQHFYSGYKDAVGGFNLPGVADPTLDALAEKVGDAENLEELTVTLRALDRVVRARRDWIPAWRADSNRLAYWDMFGFAESFPDYYQPVERLWWFDEEKAKAIGKA